MNTGAASKGPTSARLGPKLRDMADRTRNLENKRPKVMRVGRWILSENDRGDLIATHSKSKVVWTVAMANIPEGEADV